MLGVVGTCFSQIELYTTLSYLLCKQEHLKNVGDTSFDHQEVEEIFPALGSSDRATWRSSGKLPLRKHRGRAQVGDGNP